MAIAAAPGNRPLLRLLNALVVAGAIVSIPMIWLLEQDIVPLWVRIADWGVWSLFALEYGLMLSISRSRIHYIGHHWLSLAVVVLSFPYLPAVLNIVRIARLVRFLRLVRLAGVTAKALGSLGAILGRAGVIYTASLSMVLLVAGGCGLALLEPHTVRGGVLEGIWWAFVTATTVGYGDITPVTLWGRFIAVLLMLTGLGLFSTLAASIAAHFVAEDKNAEIRELIGKMERIETLLAQAYRPQEAHEGAPQDEAVSSGHVIVESR